MRVRLYAAAIAVSLLTVTAASAECPSNKARDCVINFNAVPKISESIVAGEHLVLPPQKTYVPEPIAPYSGPTVGTAPNLRRAPTVGYRWAIN